MQREQIKNFVNNTWDQAIIPTLVEYIKIPNKSPMFDAEWQKNGYMERVVQMYHDWAKSFGITGMKLEILRLPERTPLIFIEIPGQIEQTILLYGHLDKQPEMTGWREGLDPWQPVIEDNKLYGRGGADDGYAMYASLTAIKALQLQKVPHARCIIIIEACEESGSYDLKPYLEHLGDRLGEVDLVICLDSGCGNYDQLWSTTSLRGNIGGTLTVALLSEGIHSGTGSGVVASSFRVIREILDRIEDSKSGEIKLPQLHVEIPQQRIDQVRACAPLLEKEIFESTPILPGVKTVTQDIAQILLNRTWRPTLCVTGADGLPAIANAGNVLRPYTSIRISLRIPPTCNAKEATAALTEVLTANPPYHAKVTYTPDRNGSGWHAPLLADWLAKASDAASQYYFGNPAGYMGEGGSIPFMGMLGRKFPQSQFLITGVLGPKSNAHGPNEFLHIPTGKKLTCCVAEIIAAHYQQAKG